MYLYVVRACSVHVFARFIFLGTHVRLNFSGQTDGFRLDMYSYDAVTRADKCNRHVISGDCGLGTDVT